MTHKFYGHLPDGTNTHSEKEYIDAWEKPVKSLLELSDGRLVISSIDPHITLYDKQTKQSVSLPVWFAEIIQGILEK